MRASLRGAWLAVLAPTAILLLSVAGESLDLPAFVVVFLALALFIIGFGLLIKTQFARRKRNADVLTSFVIAELLGLALLALVLLLAFRH